MHVKCAIYHKSCHNIYSLHDFEMINFFFIKIFKKSSWCNLSKFNECRVYSGTKYKHCLNIECDLIGKFEFFKILHNFFFFFGFCQIFANLLSYMLNNNCMFLQGKALSSINTTKHKINTRPKLQIEMSTLIIQFKFFIYLLPVKSLFSFINLSSNPNKRKYEVKYYKLCIDLQIIFIYLSSKVLNQQILTIYVQLIIKRILRRIFFFTSL